MEATVKIFDSAAALSGSSVQAMFAVPLKDPPPPAPHASSPWHVAAERFLCASGGGWFRARCPRWRRDSGVQVAADGSGRAGRDGGGIPHGGSGGWFAVCRRRPSLPSSDPAAGGPGWSSLAKRGQVMSVDPSVAVQADATARRSEAEADAYSRAAPPLLARNLRADFVASHSDGRGGVVCVTSSGTKVSLHLEQRVRYIDKFSSGQLGAAFTEFFYTLSSSYITGLSCEALRAKCHRMLGVVNCKLF